MFANWLLAKCFFFLQKEKEKKKEEKKKERESEKPSKQLTAEKVIRVFLFSNYLKMAHSIRYVQRFGGNLVCMCVYMYVYMSCNLVNLHELFASAVTCIQRLVNHKIRNVFRRREKWVKLC